MKLISLYENISNGLSLEEAAKIFHEDCMLFRKYIDFDDSNNSLTRPLYRGMNRTELALVSRVRKDRKPSNTPINIHNLVDEWFDKKFGIKFRSNAMFATQIKSTAKAYGTLYVVFPIGEFTICSSNIITDLYFDITDLYFSSVDSHKTIQTVNDNINEYKSEIENLLDNADYKINTPIVDITRQSELMIHCDKYLAINEFNLPAFIKCYQELYQRN